VPDIIDVSTLPVERYASRGLFENLYPYIDSDPELKRDDFFSNILKALEIDGKVYQTLSAYSICAVFADKNVIPNNANLTFYEASELFRKSGKKYFYDLSGETFLSSMFCSYYVAEFVDYETGKCNFDSPEFIEYLKMLKNLPQGKDKDPLDKDIRDFFMCQSPLDFMRIMIDELPIWQKGIIIKGMPAKQGMEAIIQGAGVQLAISSTSPNKAAAWEFVRTMLTKEYQNKLYMATFRSNIAAQKAQFEFILSKSDEKRAKELEGRYNYIMELFYKTENFDRIDYSLFDIICEEALTYIYGDKSAEDVCKIIQQRVQIYVNEQM
jgi:ABC-type glycerol-3-phosphate transport system substrate-binding protein